MEFKIHSNTSIEYSGTSGAVQNSVEILRRDIEKRCTGSDSIKNIIRLRHEPALSAEEFIIKAGTELQVSANDDLGFIYGLLYISREFLGIQPFWFWMDQKIDRSDEISVKYGVYRSDKPAITFRGWFVNDEVLISKWQINNDEKEPWRMVFEALLRCGGNMVIPGTDKNSKVYRRLASDMGLWITHHHAEPLGAEMFARAYPDKEPNYAETPGLFHKLWEDAVIAQKDMKVIWTLGFRGQGDCPFWNNDSSGLYDTPEKRGRLISEILNTQKQLIKKHIKQPVLCTNLYGEIMELYEQGYIDISDDIIKIYADNGYGKMVTRRRGNHTVRISALPKERISHGGIYYHVSFYDLQAANHITMFPNSVDFVDRELNTVCEKGLTQYWIINCSNVRPHTFFLDAIREKWFGRNISGTGRSRVFADTYFSGSAKIAELYDTYSKAMLSYGSEEDEHAGEQFYTENVRLLIHAFFNGKKDGTSDLIWLVGNRPLYQQIQAYADLCRNNLDKISAFYEECRYLSDELTGSEKTLFDATLLLHASIHYFCTMGVTAFGDGFKRYEEQDMLDAFMLFGKSAELFARAAGLLRESEYGVWKGFYYNDCLADIKYTAYMLEKLMGYVRELGDNTQHYKWQRQALYAPEDARILTILFTDNHLTDKALYEALSKRR